MNTLENVIKKMDLEFFGTNQHMISPEEFLKKNDAVFLDVRSNEEIQTVNILLKHHVSVLHIPANNIPNRLSEIPKDKFIGIPVTWSQITNAKVIVETDLEDFPLDASLGSHFFHNVTSMNIGYFSVHSGGKNFLNYEILNQQEVISKLKFFKHVRFKKPLDIVMDGKKRESVICIGNGEPCKEKSEE